MKLFVNCEYISKSLLSIHGILSHYEAYNMRICIVVGSAIHHWCSSNMHV